MNIYDINLKKKKVSHALNFIHIYVTCIWSSFVNFFKGLNELNEHISRPDL